MIVGLTAEQRQAIEECGGKPLYLVDAATNAGYVLMRAEQFEQLRTLLGEEFDPREAYPFVERVMQADDADDPSLASYQVHPRRRP
jgi:hypothetical protein